MIDNPSLEVSSYPNNTTRTGKNLACDPIHPPSPLTMTIRQRPKSYDILLLCQCACLAHHRNVSEDLDIVGNDGKLNEDSIHIYAHHL